MLFVIDSVPYVSECLNKKALQESGNFILYRNRRTCNLHLRYGDEFLLLAKGENVLQGKIDRLIDIGLCYGMEKNMRKTTIPTTDYDSSKKTEECGMFQPFDCLVQYLS